MKEKKKVVSFQISNLLIFEWEITFFSNTTYISHNILYCQQLSIARYQASFNANNYFE